MTAWKNRSTTKGEMKLYTSTGTRKLIEKCNQMNVGLLMVADWRNPDKWPFFAIDNGCFSAYNRNEEWNASTFMKLLHRCKIEKRTPEFIVIPDKVASPDSLEFSKSWLPVLKKMYPGMSRYLAVQNGMTPDSVIDGLGGLQDIQGIFVGGTMEWKMDTMKIWIDMAHENDLECHVGRIGPIQRMLMCEIAGADSIDSTTWVQNRGGMDHYVKGYYSQTMLEVEDSE